MLQFKFQNDTILLVQPGFVWKPCLLLPDADSE